ncbi:MAG: exodeoxyribonuclease III [Actinomycetota bacterium]|nr:exodeoxyribonuclease III [Actinomycetota bacterium]
MRIATWNVNSLKARMPRVEEWLAEMEPDVLCLQETKLSDEAFPALAFEALGYESVHHGQGQWNGVAILSRVGITGATNGFDDGDEPDPDARAITATCGGVRVTSVYVPNGRTLDDDHYTYKLRWLERLRRVAAEHADEPTVICGDFNIAPDDRDIWDPAAFVGSTHVSAPEREAFEALLECGFTDALRARHGDVGLYTYWDYRDGNFHKKKGMRIDHLLVSRPLAEHLRFVFVDRNARKGSKPSDHTAAIVELAWAPAEEAAA